MKRVDSVNLEIINAVDYISKLYSRVYKSRRPRIKVKREGSLFEVKFQYMKFWCIFDDELALLIRLTIKAINKYPEAALYLIDGLYSKLNCFNSNIEAFGQGYFKAYLDAYELRSRGY